MKLHYVALAATLTVLAGTAIPTVRVLASCGYDPHKCGDLLFRSISDNRALTYECMGDFFTLLKRNQEDPMTGWLAYYIGAALADASRPALNHEAPAYLSFALMIGACQDLPYVPEAQALLGQLGVPIIARE